MKIVKLMKTLVGNSIRVLYKGLYRFITIDDKMVIFISFHGRGYSDSPKAIFEEMRADERFKDYKFIWAIKNKSQKNEEILGAKVVEYFSVLYFYYMSKAKFWIINCKMPEYICKKKNQVYLQTWHGTPLKRLGHDIIVPEGTTFYRSGMSFEAMTKSYDADAARYDYMISPNEFSTEVFQTAFGVERKRLIETGYPRNDFIVNANAKECSQIKKKFGIPEDKKVLLYAPTWRDNSYDRKGYTFELKADFYKWKEMLGDEYVLIFKPHYLIVNNYKDTEDLNGFLFNISAEAEINELYVISDILVTDYSSVFFDYSVLNRPVYFYMYDLEEYKDELRGFYLDIYKDLPGVVYENESEMLSDIKNEVYDYGLLGRFNERFNAFHDGTCSKKVVNILLNGIENEN